MIGDNEFTSPILNDFGESIDYEILELCRIEEVTAQTVNNQKEQMKNGFIEIKEQTKTGNPVVIPIHQVVKRIIQKHNGELPRAITNQKFNEYLKEIGIMVQSLHTPFETTITKGGFKVARRLNKYELFFLQKIQKIHIL